MPSFLSGSGDEGDPTPQVRRRRILIADDDTTSRVLMRAAFEESGFLVVEAEDGVAAIELFTTREPDLVVLDVMMPRMDGFEACIELRRQSTETPILLLTGLDDLASINRAYAVGATDFATKPINWILLSHRLRYLLRSAEALASERRNKGRLETAQRIAQLGYWERRLDSIHLRCTPEIMAILGDDPLTRTLTVGEFMSRIHEDDRTRVEEREEALIRSGESSGIDFRIVRPDGRLRYVRQETEVSTMKDGRAATLVGTLQDVSERREAEDRARFLAHHDPLTRLPNRAGFLHWLESRVGGPHDTHLAVLCFDVDQFSRINETMGRNLGDIVLQRLAERLQGEALTFQRSEQGPGGLIAAHFGGDKFMFATTGLSRDEDVAVVARGIQAAMRQPFVLDRRELFASISAGLCLFPRDGKNAEELVANAESAVRHAKSESRGSCRFFSRAENHRTAQALSVESDLRRAVERGELRLHFQPQIDPVLNTIVGVEALLRWQHPSRGLLAPQEFMDVAEDTGLIVPMGEWVLRTACEQMNELRESGIAPCAVSVNLSPRQLRDKGLTSTIQRILQRTGLPARYLELEITETGLMGQALSEISVLHELKALGARISIDDFGTGYSSLSYLTRLPIDTLKIDKSFISECTEKSAAASIVRTIIAMSSSLHLTTIAEGVEREAQLNLLMESGCHLVQGFLVAKPLPLTSLAKWMRDWAQTHSASGTRAGHDPRRNGSEPSPA